jgi:hypothetical protein
MALGFNREKTPQGKRGPVNGIPAPGGKFVLIRWGDKSSLDPIRVLGQIKGDSIRCQLGSGFGGFSKLSRQAWKLLNGPD